MAVLTVFLEPENGYRSSMDAKIILAASVVIVRQARFLLVERGRAPAKGMYAFPGGRVRPGEAIEDAARRELLEETSLTVRTMRMLRQIDLDGQDAGSDIIFRLHVFLADEPFGTAKAGDDAAALGWYTLADMNRLPVTLSTRQFAAELASELGLDA